MTNIYSFVISEQTTGIFFGPISTYEFEDDYSLVLKLKAAPDGSILHRGEGSDIIVSSLSMEMLMGYSMGAKIFMYIIHYGLDSCLDEMFVKEANNDVL